MSRAIRFRRPRLDLPKPKQYASAAVGSTTYGSNFMFTRYNSGPRFRDQRLRYDPTHTWIGISTIESYPFASDRTVPVRSLRAPSWPQDRTSTVRSWWSETVCRPLILVARCLINDPHPLWTRSNLDHCFTDQWLSRHLLPSTSRIPKRR
jgi:hypothetical protein